MLNEKQKKLLAETAKFFKENPDRFTVGTLYENGPVLGDSTCYCTVGYMGRRLMEMGELTVTDKSQSIYNAVGRFFDEQFGADASCLFDDNDAALNAEDAAGRLIKRIKDYA